MLISLTEIISTTMLIEIILVVTTIKLILQTMVILMEIRTTTPLPIMECLVMIGSLK